MGSVNQVRPNGAEKKRVAELKCDVQDGHGEVGDGIMGYSQGLLQKDESRINEAALDITDGRGAAVAPWAQQVIQQQQPVGPIVRWEKILPVRTLKVLLVESDDSTRQVVCALLRNCSYEVTTAANGLQAWKTLENLTNRIDLVLTEVVMPCLSGIGLLSKIMSHNICKSIPVIMMSSNDSMGIVFKCLSKGAVDFLVKPIRKNELKNLWQHVWRRCHSSSGSVSESGIQTQKSPKSKSCDDSDNSNGSNDEDENGSIGLSGRDGSDNGSGTQTSWTKHAIEVESSHPLSPSDADPHDSTCAQVMPRPETFCNGWMPMSGSRDCQEHKELADGLMGKDLEIGVPRIPDAQHESYPNVKVPTKPTGTAKDKVPETDQTNESVTGHGSSNVFDEPSAKAADLIGGIANNTDVQLVNSVTGTPNCFSGISESKDKMKDGSMELPSLHLSLKRPRSTGETKNDTNDNHNILRHSDLSAFSRYRTTVSSTQPQKTYVASCSLLDNSSEAVKTEAAKQGSNGSSNNNDMGSTTKNAFTNPTGCKEKTVSAFIHPSSAFHPVQHRNSSQQVIQEKHDGVTASRMVGPPRGAQRQFQVQHHHHHYHHHHHHVHSMQQPPDHDDLSHENMAQCDSSNVFSEPVEGNAANYSLNGSNPGSNHGSNGQNGSSTGVNAGGTNMESANGIAEKCEVGGGSGSGSGMDHNRFTQREAALNKFRQKRKERNFVKKVRYQSRKRLAEQRPRVRGQFVRQTAYEHNSGEADS